jgi:hypothetical protein
MPGIKRLRSVCHSIAHHATSGLSYIHPHLAQACNNAGLESIAIDLKQEEPCPDAFVQIKPLRLALHALRKKFEEILSSEGFAPTDLRTATLTFEFPSKMENYSSNCHACMTTNSGRIVKYSVNCVGEMIAPKE